MPAARGGLPLVLFSSAVFDAKDPADDTPQAAFDRGLVKRPALVDAGGLRVGLFALIGDDAAEVAPFASPVTFRPAIVVCVSHAGLWADPGKSEDGLLAKAVPGIDVIISGHTHTRMGAPRTVGSTVIVQAWEQGKQVGVLDLAAEGGAVRVEGWQAAAVDDARPRRRPGSETWWPTRSTGTRTRPPPIPPTRAPASPWPSSPTASSGTASRAGPRGSSRRATSSGCCRSAWARTARWATR